MATFTYNVDNSVVPEVVEALCLDFNYQPLIRGVPNPETKNAFVYRVLTEQFTSMLKHAVIKYRKSLQANIDTSVETDYNGKIT